MFLETMHEEKSKVRHAKTGDEYNIVTSGNLKFLVKLIHKHRVRKVKKLIRDFDNLNITRSKRSVTTRLKFVDFSPAFVIKMSRGSSSWLIVYEDETTQIVSASEFTDLIYMDLDQQAECIQCVIRL